MHPNHANKQPDPMRNKKIGWIDFCKGIAIVGVVLDHCFGYSYTNRLVQYHTAFSVPLFVFLGGITSAISLEKKRETFLTNVTRRIKKILYPFLLGTLGCSFYLSGWKFILLDYLNLVINFNGTAPYYFVFFYIQLIAISPVIYHFIFKAKNSIWLHCCLLVSTIVISIFAQKYTFMLPIHGGGKYLLGGSYLFMFTLGMMFYRYRNTYSGIKINLGLFILAVSILTCYESFNLFAISWKNPPNSFTAIYSLSIFFLIYSGRTIFGYLNLEKIETIPLKYFKNIICCSNKLGKYSLAIFIFHTIALTIEKKIVIFSGLNIKILGSTLHTMWLILFCVVVSILIWNQIYLRFLKILDIVLGDVQQPGQTPYID